MRKKSAIILFFLIFTAIFSIELLSGKSGFTYIGAEKCGKCHGDDALGNQYKIWLSSSHSRAFVNLAKPRGMAVAKKAGVEDPQKSIKCLRCHTTGRGRKGYLTEGVGCESCHGPGSVYHKPSIHVDLNYRENGYRRALKYGMYHIRGDDRLKFREKLCLSCHSPERPCYPETRKERLQQKMTIQVVDSLMRGSANLRHPVRR